MVTTTAPPSTTTDAGNGIKTPKPVHRGIFNNCANFHTAEGYIRNPDVDKASINLCLGAYACAVEIGSTPKPTATVQPTTSKPDNGISIPTPIEPGIASNFDKFHIIKSTIMC
ncbi:hypothetical protein LRP88_02228 [Fusarium phalaenopsidis]